MFAQKKTSTDIPYIEGLFPRSLITSGRDVFHAQTTSEGLCPLRIHLESGFVKELEIISYSPESKLNLILPRLVEPHAHIDKAFSWTSSPNLEGTYQGALKANFQEHKNRTMEKVRSRANRALEAALKNGLRAIRSHIDSFGKIGDQSWEALLDVKREWEALIDLQLVALVPLDYWATGNGEELARRVANENGLLGGVIAPPYETKELKRLMSTFFSLANDLGCGVDLHIDETNIFPGRGVKELLDTLDKMNVDIKVTCSHLSSMSLMEPKSLSSLADKLADHEVNVVALPLTNFWLLAHDANTTPLKRPLAPIRQLQNAGVTVAIGGDNVQDPWYPGGNFDPLSLMAASIPMTHLVPWKRLGLEAFTTAPSHVMGLDCDGTLEVGCAADFIFFRSR